ncbi:hypothetical protein Aph02nite_20150 [Actinoplanes philippinensis]|uniref:IPT/TIG domain-containing protein n=1 Tax=Actinoplanes philippinensis TaxID=35752 RepID=A0A1I2BTJ3_9ACTN|nr:IPT/TIG domain-containing protein [Actinoplanes philippinensis]GIE76065.1 hypothetical protein Aph02nite_20150 [Actinoplanes philippinensis]SFE58620.1 IPT/TIG domain-containing protein [Actinoplanes philippinensis]
MLFVTPEPVWSSPSVNGMTPIASSDATLSNLVPSGGGVSGLGPSFDPGNHYYQAMTNTAEVLLTPTPAEGGSTVAVKLNGAAQALTNGAADLDLERGRNEVLITVTAPNGVATEEYHVAVWLGLVPVPTIVSVSNPSATVHGGSRSVVTVRDGTPPPWPTCFNPRVEVANELGDDSGDVESTIIDPDSGLTRIVVEMPDVDQAGVYDLRVLNQCQSGNSVAISEKAITYVDDFPVTGVEAPEPLTAGKVIKFHGKNVTNMADDVEYWVANADGSKIIEMEPYEYWAGDDTAAVMLEYRSWGDVYLGDGKRYLRVGHCENSVGDADCRIFFSKEVDWVAPAPVDVSFSPSSGPVAGGTKIRMRGRFLVSSRGNLEIKVGGNTVDSFQTINNADWEDEEYPDLWSNGYDVVEFLTPPATLPGAVPITATTRFGATAARGTFTYGARPEITTISPATVADSGGSVITLTGTGFGTSGRPSVIINGVKSPYVTRVGSTRAYAVVPPSNDTGPVDVQVVSPQGGGTSGARPLTLAAPSTLPSITTIRPTTAKPGDSVTITGTNFGTAGTVGVAVGDVWARVTASTATSVTFDVPVVDTPGPQAVLVGATTGAVAEPSGLTVLPQPAISSVSPGAIPSYATGSAAKVTLTGVGFGATGKVKVGAAAAVSYTAAGGGTSIADVVVPTAVAGSLPVVVTPAGSTEGIRSTVRVTAPTLTYVGGDPHEEIFEEVNLDDDDRGAILESPVTGGARMRLEGTGFGSSGTVKVGRATVTPISYSDTAIVLRVPAHAVGTESVTVAPGGGAVTVSRPLAVRYVAAIVRPSIVRIVSATDLGHPTRSDFDPGPDLDDTFTLVGTDLIGTSAAKTRIVVSDFWGDNPIPVTPRTVTATSVTFSAPRTVQSGGWKRVTVITDVGSAYAQHGINYLQQGLTLSASATSGSCLRQPQPAGGGVTHAPAAVTITNSGTAFGSTGTVTIDGVAVTPDTYTNASITFDMGDLTSNLSSPWGGKTILITPTDNTLPAQKVGFTCIVPVSAATTVNGGTVPVTVDAGASFTMGYTTGGFISPDTLTVANPGGYEYVTAVQYADTGFTSGVKAGVPAAAGDYFIRVARSRATYAGDRYRFTADPEPVRVTITGKAITLTPQSANGPSFVYKGRLTGGAAGSAADVTYTVQSSVTPDRITGLVWEYRNSSCDGLGIDQGWTEGIPQNVARESDSCGGDPTQLAAWDVRVKSFEMKASGVDRSGLYLATRPTVRFAITPKPVTVAAVRADRVYDGTTTARLTGFSLTGTVPGDDLGLTGDSGGGTFATPAAGVNKTVTLGADITLSGGAAGNYALSDPRPAVVGTISKADATLGLAVDRAAVLLSQGTPVTVTADVRDTRTGQAPDGMAGVAPVMPASETPDVCTVGMPTVTVLTAGWIATPIGPGTCVISGQQAASTNYNASRAVSDNTSTVEYAEFQVFAAAQTISVIADDLIVAEGDQVIPTAQFTGLFDGDEISNVPFEYFRGATPLGSTAPTEPGTYRIVPAGGTLAAANNSAYTNPSSFRAVAGSLVITPRPPAVTKLVPSSGYVSGGTLVTVTGERLDTVRSLRIGDTTLRAGEFQANEAGTELTFRTPRVPEPVIVTITFVAGTAETEETYNYLADPEPSPSPSPTPQVPFEPEPSPSPSESPSPSPSGSESPSPSPSVSLTPSPSPSASSSPTPAPSPTPSQTPAPSPTPQPTENPQPTGPVQLNLSLELEADSKLVGANATMTGGGLKPASDYVLTMNSEPVVIASGKTDAAGDFRALITMPGKACVAGGLHELVLTGTAPDGTTVRDSNWVVLDDTCTASTGSGTKPPKDFTVPLGWFIFPYQSAHLSPKAKKTIRQSVSAMRGAKLITITGYTQTKKKSKAAKKANRILALKRAKAVRDYLRKLKVRTTIKTVGAGGVNPVDEHNQKLNRRVTIRVRY